MSYIFPSVVINYITYTAKRWGQFPTITYREGAGTPSDPVVTAGNEVVTLIDDPMSSAEIIIKIEAGASTNAQIKAAILASDATVGSLAARDLVTVVITSGHTADTNAIVSATPMTGGSENLPAMQAEVVLKGFKDNATSLRVSGLDIAGAYVQSYSGIFYDASYLDNGSLATRFITGGNDGMDVEVQSTSDLLLSAVANGSSINGIVKVNSSTSAIFNTRTTSDTLSTKRFIIDRVDVATQGTGNTSDVNLDVNAGNLRLMAGNVLGTVVLPVLTATEIGALTPVEGMIVYNVTDHKLNIRVAAAWEEVTSAV
jgi:hypothetical protein